MGYKITIALTTLILGLLITLPFVNHSSTVDAKKRPSPTVTKSPTATPTKIPTPTMPASGSATFN
jgi:hypothetical protein